MNLIERYNQFKLAKKFNSPNIKGVITVNEYSFDIRLVDGELYANSLPLKDFFDEAMLNIDEELFYEEAIFEWLSHIPKSQVA